MDVRPAIISDRMVAGKRHRFMSGRAERPWSDMGSGPVSGIAVARGRCRCFWFAFALAKSSPSRWSPPPSTLAPALLLFWSVCRFEVRLRFEW